MKKKKKKKIPMSQNMSRDVFWADSMLCGGCCCHVGNDINLGEAGIGGKGL